MPLGCRKFHKIRKLATNCGTNYSVTITHKAEEKFKGAIFEEHILNNGILLIKSGCELDEKEIIMA